MVSMGILVFFTVSLMASMIQAYQIAAKVRVRDQARFVLSTVSDQFLRGPYFQGNGSTIQPFFTTTASPTGVGMAWQDQLQVFAYPPLVSDPHYIEGTASGLAVTIGQSGSQAIAAILTREVSTIDPATGLPAVVTPTATGLMVRGTFTLTYTYQSKTYSQSVSVLRTAP